MSYRHRPLQVATQRRRHLLLHKKISLVFGLALVLSMSTPSIQHQLSAMLGGIVPTVKAFSGEPVPAMILATSPGLHYQIPSLLQLLYPVTPDAYINLVKEGHIPAESIIVTNRDNIQQEIAALQSELQRIEVDGVSVTEDGQQQAIQAQLHRLVTAAITSVVVGPGLRGAVASNDLNLAIVPGEGVVATKDGVSAILGEDVDLLSEVVGILPIENGGTGVGTVLPANHLLVSNGTNYIGGRLAVGDGLALSVANGTFTFAVDATVCLTSGNCAGSGGGLVGSGATNQLAFFTSTSNIGSSSILTLDTDNQLLSVDGVVDSSGYHVAGQPISTDNVAEGSALYWTANRFDLRLATKSTSDLAEGSNLYFTDSRVSANTDVAANTAARHPAATVTDSTTLNLTVVGQQISGTVVQSGLQTSLFNNDASFVANLSSFDTDDLSEGANLYYTSTRFDNRLSSKTTDDLAQGTNNLYSQWANSASGIVFGESVGIGAITDPAATLEITGSFAVSGAITASSFTTKGGLLYTNASGVVAQLAAGTSGQCLVSTADVPGWGSCGDTLPTDNVTGTGAAGQVAFWDGENTQSSSSTLSWYAASNSLNINSSSVANGYFSIRYNLYSDTRIDKTGLSLRAKMGPTFEVGSIDGVGYGMRELFDGGSGGYGERLILGGFGGASRFETADGTTSYRIDRSTTINRAEILSSAGIQLTATTDITVAGTSDLLLIGGGLTIGSLTTNGGLLYTNASGAMAQLGAGSLGQCLVSTASIPEWGSCGDTLPADNVTGSGAAGQVAVWGGTNSQTGSGIQWDSEDSQLKLGDNGVRLGIWYGHGSELDAYRLIFGDRFSESMQVSRQGIESIHWDGAPSTTCLNQLMLAAHTIDDPRLSFCDRSIELRGNEASGSYAELYSAHGFQFTSGDNSAFTISGSSDLVLSGGELSVGGLGDSSFAGNVGIGTTDPGYKLEVSGGIGLAGAVTTLSEGDIFSQLDGDASLTYPVFARYWDSHGTWPSTTFIFGNGTNSVVGIEKPGNLNISLFRVRADQSSFNGDLLASGGLTIGSGGAEITGHLSATTTWDPANVTTGTVATTTVTVTGAALGDVVGVSFDQVLPAGATLTGAVTAANTVTISLTNLSGGDQDLPSGTVRASVTQY